MVDTSIHDRLSPTIPNWHEYFFVLQDRSRPDLQEFAEAAAEMVLRFYNKRDLYTERHTAMDSIYISLPRATRTKLNSDDSIAILHHGYVFTYHDTAH